VGRSGYQGVKIDVEICASLRQGNEQVAGGNVQGGRDIFNSEHDARGSKEEGVERRRVKGPWSFVLLRSVRLQKRGRICAFSG